MFEAKVCPSLRYLGNYLPCLMTEPASLASFQTVGPNDKNSGYA